MPNSDFLSIPSFAHTSSDCSNSIFGLVWVNDKTRSIELFPCVQERFETDVFFPRAENHV